MTKYPAYTSSTAHKPTILLNICFSDENCGAYFSVLFCETLQHGSERFSKLTYYTGTGVGDTGPQERHRYWGHRHWGRGQALTGKH